MNRRGQEGQATVELALALPLLVLLALLLLQVGLVVRDQVLVTHAAREAARQAAVDPDKARVRDAARQSANFDDHALTVSMDGRGQPGSKVRVTVTYKSPTNVPIIGAMIDDVTLRATATMRVET